MIKIDSTIYKTYSDSPSENLIVRELSQQEIERVVATLFHSENIEMTIISGGLNNLITGGGLLKIRLPDKESNIVAKVVPSFEVEQKSLATILEKTGHAHLARILAQYPSNNIGEREVETYNLLVGQINLPLPKMHFGYINKIDRSALLIIDDLSDFTPLHLIEDKEIVVRTVRNMIGRLAKFHSSYYQRMSALSSRHWLGNWWQTRNSDYLSHEVAQYSLDSCTRFVTDPVVLDILTTTLHKREKLWDRYNRYKFNTLIHWDLNSTNILVDTKTQDTSFKVIDWQTTTVGIPQWDLAQLLIPLSDKLTHEEIEELIDLYCEQFKARLPDSEKTSFDRKEFKELFDVVVADHSFRTTINVLLSQDPAGSEWEKCLAWTKYKMEAIKDFLDGV